MLRKSLSYVDLSEILWSFLIQNGLFVKRHKKLKYYRNGSSPIMQ